MRLLLRLAILGRGFAAVCLVDFPLSRGRLSIRPISARLHKSAVGNGIRTTENNLTKLTLRHAFKLWEYMSSPRTRGPSDAIVVCCSYDLRVCDYACDLLKQGLAPRLVLTGKTGHWTRHLWGVAEAHVFRERALRNGVDSNLIVIEDQATNFGENIAFTRNLVPEATQITFVTKPNSILRVALTVPVHWPGVTAFVDSPPIQFPDEVSHVIGLFGVINEMVGDIDRILQYPRSGFQQGHDVPSDVLESWRFLVKEGFSHHLLRSVDQERSQTKYS